MNKYERTFQGFMACKGYRRTWAFPREVERLLMSETVELGKSTLHLYGGIAKFGVTLDVDPTVEPDVVGNALFPPFKCKSFDVVIMDPPYAALPGWMGMQILGPAACLARERIWWLHTHWGPGGALGLKLLRWWVVSPCSKGSPLRLLSESQVTRHPEYCHAVPEPGRKQLRPAFRKYDWSRIIGRPPRRERHSIQGRLL